MSERLRFGAARFVAFVVRLGIARAALLVVLLRAVLVERPAPPVTRFVADERDFFFIGMALSLHCRLVPTFGTG